MMQRYLPSHSRIPIFILVILVMYACGGAPSHQDSDILHENLMPSQMATSGATIASPPDEIPNAAINPPILLSHSPRNGEVVSPDIEITLNFNTEMDTESVEQALHLVPDSDIAFTFIWENNTSLRIIPGSPGFPLATRFELYIDDSAIARSGLKLVRENKIVFTIVPYLKVTQSFPSANETVSRADFPLQISFNQPVVDGGCIKSDHASVDLCQTDILNISPPILGEGRWVHQTVYEFKPYKDWNAGGTYHISLLPDIVSVAGVGLSTPQEWDFSLSEPAITAVSPLPGARNVPLSSSISIWFNTPMDTTATGSEVVVRSASGAKVSGKVNWLDSATHLIFTPGNHFDMDTSYEVQIGARARARSSTPLINPKTWLFTTFSYPEVVDLIPADGTTGFENDEPIRILFSGAIDETTLSAGVTISPILQSQQLYFDQPANALVINGKRQPGADYCVAVSSVTDIFGNMLQNPVTHCFTSGNFPAEFSIANDLPVQSIPVTKPSTVQFHNLNTESVNFTLSVLDALQFIRRDIDSGTNIREWTEVFSNQVNSAEVVAVSLQRFQDDLPTGFYRLEWQADIADNEQTYITVVNLNIVLKLSAGEVMAWVTDISTGAAISHTAVSFYNTTGDLFAGGTSDDDGLVRLPINDINSVWETVTAIVGQPGTDQFGIVQSNWFGQAPPDYFNIEFSGGPFNAHHVYLWTDHREYQPGQSVHFYGYLLERTQNTYKLTLDQPTLRISLHDQSSNIIYETQTKVLPSGMFEGSFLLDNLIPQGSYTVTLVFDETNESIHSSTSVKVFQTVREQFDVAVYANTSNLYVGDTLRFYISAVNAPADILADTPFIWQVLSEPEFHMPGSYLETALPIPYTWNTRSFLHESTVVTSGFGTTDAFGNATVVIPTDLSQPIFNSNYSREQLWRFRVQFETNIGDTDVTETVIHVKKSTYRLGILLNSRVIEAGKRITFDVLALRDDWDPVVGASVVVTLTEKPESAWDPLGALTVNDVTPDKKVALTTDTQGKASGFFSNNPSGAYVISAALTDPKGQTIVSSESLWISGSEAVTSSLQSQYIQPVTDQEAYIVGDVAHVLLPISYTGSYQVLLTLERESILYTEILSLDGGNPIVEIPILDNYSPNVYVSFTAILPIDNAWMITKSGYVELIVQHPENLLHIQVTPDQDFYHTGDQAMIRVRITDEEMLPVDADVLFSLQEKNEATPSFTRELYKNIAGQLPLQVASGNSLSMSSVGSPFVNNTGLNQPSGNFQDQILKDANVPETLFVRYSKQYVSDGEIIFSVDVPESHKSWEINVFAVSQQKQFGIGQGEIAVTGTIGIKTLLPSVFIAEDLSEIKSIIRNQTGAEQRLTLEFVPVESIESIGEPLQGVVLQPFSQQTLAWQVRIPNSHSARARFEITVTGEGYQDVYSPTAGKGIPIVRYFSPEPRAISGLMSGEEHFVDIIEVPNSSLSNTTLSVYLEPQISGAFISGFDYVDAYPLNTTDVIAARLLTRLNMEKVFANIFDESWMTADLLSSDIASELDVIYSRQNENGGWGWLLSESHLPLTSYVTLGLIRSLDAGYPIRTIALDSALDFITRSITETLATRDGNTSVAGGLYVLSMANRELPINVVSQLYEDHSLLTVSGKAYLALALGVRDPADPRIGTLVNEILAVAESRSSFGMHWYERSSQYLNTDTQATAIVLDMLLSMDGEFTDISGIVNYLLSVRNGKVWDSPLETALVLDALAKYAIKIGYSESSFNWGVTLNNQPLLDNNDDSTAGMVYEKIVSLDESVKGAIVTGENSIEYARGAGEGNLYYSSKLNLAVPMGKITAESRGISILREYCQVHDGSTGTVSYLDTHCSPIQTVPNATVFESRLTIFNPETRYNLAIIDYIPSGLISVNATGYIMSDTWGRPGYDRQSFTTRFCDPFKCLFLADLLEPGTYQIIYYLQAEIPGVYHVLPAEVYELNSSEVWAQSQVDQITILK